MRVGTPEAMALDDLLAAAAAKSGSAPTEGATPATDSGATGSDSNSIVLDEHAAGVIGRAGTIPTELTIVSPEFLALIGVAAQVDDLPAATGAEGTNSSDQINEDFARINKQVLETIREDSRKVLDTVDQLVVPAMHEYIGVEEEKRSALMAAPLGSPASAALAAVAAARGTQVTGMADEKLEAAIRLFNETYPDDMIAAVGEVPAKEDTAEDTPAGGEMVDKIAPLDTAPAPAATGSGYGTSPLSPSLPTTAVHSPATALSSALPAMSAMGMGMPFVGSPISANVPGPGMGGFGTPYAAMMPGAVPSALSRRGQGLGGLSLGGSPASGGAGIGTGASGLGGSGVTRDELRQMVEDARKRIESERGATRPSSDEAPRKKLSTPPSPTAPSSPSPSGGDRAGSGPGGSTRDLGSSTALRGQTVSGGMVDKALINSGASGGTGGLSAATASAGGGGSSQAGGMRGGMPMGMMPMMGAMGAAAGRGGSGSGMGGGTSFDLPEDYRIQDSAERMRGNAVVGGVLRPGAGNLGDGLVEPSRRQDSSAEPERRTGLFG